MVKLLCGKCIGWGQSMTAPVMAPLPFALGVRSSNKDVKECILCLVPCACGMLWTDCDMTLHALDLTAASQF